jgi:uncharacterized membrane protein
MSDKKKSLVYSLSRETAEHLAKEAEEHLSITYDFLNETLDKQKEDEFKISLLCDYFSSNYKLKVELARIFQVYDDVDDTAEAPEEKDLFISQENMVIIETILLARYYLAKDLQEYSNLSFHLH